MPPKDKPRRDEDPKRAIRMFSSVSTLARGESERDVEAEWLIVSAAGLGLVNSTEGVSLTIGEYCEMGDAPLKAPTVESMGAGGEARPFCFSERDRPWGIRGDGEIVFFGDGRGLEGRPLSNRGLVIDLGFGDGPERVVGGGLDRGASGPRTG